MDPRTQADAVAETLARATEHFLELQTQDGLRYKAKLTGTLIATGKNSEIFLTMKQNTVAYDQDRGWYFVIEDPEEDLHQWLDDDGWLEAMDALGLDSTIDLDV